MKNERFYSEYEQCICAKCFEAFYRKKGSTNQICIPCKEGFGVEERNV